MKETVDSILAHVIAGAGENETTEYKDRKTLGKDDVGKYFSALSNEANLRDVESAWLLFGVTDDGRIVNSNYLDTVESRNELKRYMSEQVSGGLSFTDIHERIIDGCRVLLLEIPAATTGVPTTFKGIAYERQGDSLVPLSDGKRMRIMGESAPDWSGRTTDAALDDLDPDALAFARDHYAKNRPSMAEECRSWSDEKFLDKVGLRRNGALTNAALVLLGSEGSEPFLDAEPSIRWILRDRDGSTIDSEIFGLPLLTAVEDVCAKIRNVNYWLFDDGRTSKRTVKTYDEKLLREAIYNCIMHQDYSKCEFITVEEIDRERLVFRNAGQFIPGSVESVIDLDRPEGYYRNRCLAKSLYRLGFAEIAGGGIIRMFRCQAERGFPLPDYNLDDGHVTVSVVGRPSGGAYEAVVRTNPMIPLSDLVAIDRIQKGKDIRCTDANRLVLAGYAEPCGNGLVLRAGPGDPGRKVADPMEIRTEIARHLDAHGSATKTEVVELVRRLCPGRGDEAVVNSASNALSVLRRNGTIVNTGTVRKPLYRLTSEVQGHDGGNSGA